MTQSEEPPEFERGERHLLDVGNEHLSFRRVGVPDPVPTARQILVSNSPQKGPWIGVQKGPR